MWGFQSKRNPLRDRMMLAAPEVNPHDFVRRYLRAKPQPRLERLQKAGLIPDESAHRPASVV
jgi:hypothetical protein